MRGDEPQLGRRDLELSRHETVHLCGWLELANRVNGEAPFEVLADSGVLQLLLHGRRRRVGERDQPESGRSQLLESVTNVGMRRQRDQAAQNSVAIRRRERHAVRDRCHVQRATCDGPEVHVRSGNRRDLRVQHDVGEPLLCHPGVSEETLELGRQRADVEECFIHVKHNDPLASRGSDLAPSRRWSHKHSGGRR